MLVYRGFAHSQAEPTALTVGNFDGLHLGHRALLQRLKALAQSDGLCPAVLSFEPHAREFFSPLTAPVRLSTLREANRLVVLDRGSVVEVGNHDDLMALEGHYYRLYQAQARNVDTEDELRLSENNNKPGGDRE